MRMYSETEGWAAMKRDLKFTVAMLKASGVHAVLTRGLVGHLAQWSALDGEVEAAADAVTEANAVVAWVNVKLDGHTERFAAQLLGDCGGNRAHKSFQAFFPKPAGEVVRMALETQVEAMAGFAERATEVKLSKSSAALLKDVLAALEEGREAIAQRKTAEAGVKRVSRKQEAWRDEANKVRRTVETSLADHANQNDLARGYPDEFFPTKAVKKSAAKKPAKRPDAPVA